jgi:hypothetical protein
MKQKEVYTVFEYDPQGERLILTTNEKLRYNFNDHKYCIDQNPFGEEKLADIYDIKISDDFSLITFNTIYRKKEKNIKLIVNNSIDKILYKIFYETLDKKIDVNENEMDHIKIVILNNELNTIYIYKKNKKCELINSLGVVTKNNVLFYEEVEPEYKLYEFIEIKSENKKIIIETKEKTVEYPLDIQDIVYNIFEEIMNNIK